MSVMRAMRRPDNDAGSFTTGTVARVISSWWRAYEEAVGAGSGERRRARAEHAVEDRAAADRHRLL